MSDVGEVSVKITADASGVDRAISNVKGQFSQLSNDLTGIAKGFNLDNVASQIDKVSDKFKGLGTTLAISAAPFEIYGVLAVNAFADFEQGIAKINTLLPDATKAEMEAVGEQLKSFSSEFGADINDAIQAYYDALSAGVAQGDVLPFMETAQKAGVAGVSDVSVAVDGLTSILNSYQKKTSEAENVSDVMFKTVELGKIEFEQLAANIGKVAPTAAQFKIGFEDVGAAIASITSQGLKPEQTMTVLTSLISQLGQSGTELSEKFKEITGQSFPDFIASGGTLADAIGKIRDYSQETGTSLMDMTGNLEAAKGLAMLGGSAFEQYAGFLDKISDSAGATETAYSKMSETMAFAMDQLKAQMQTTLIEVGDALAPVVKDFTQWLSENSDEISDFAVSIAQNAVPAIEKLFDIMKKLMDSFNNLPGDTKSILGQLLGVGAVGAAAGGPLLFGAGVALGPVSSILKLLGSFNGSNLSNASKDVDALSDAVKKLAGSTGNYKIAEDIALIGPAAATAAGSGGVGALTTALSTIAVPAFGLLFATQADHVMDAVGRLTTDYLRDVRMEVEVQSILGKPDETGFRSWLVEFTKQPIEIQIKAVPLLGSAYELGEQFSQDLFLQANNDFSQNTVLKNKFNQFQTEAKTAVEAAGKSVKTFTHRDVAEMNNYLEKSKDKFKEFGITTVDQFKDAADSATVFDGEFKRIVDNIEELSIQTGESIESLMQRMINGDFTPVQFKDGTIFYTYQNNVLKPIESDPLLIGIDEGKYQEGFARVKAAYDDLKQYIASNKIEADINISKTGDISQTQGATPAMPYDPKRGTSGWSWAAGAVTYAKDTETATQNGTEAAAPVIAEETGKSVAEQLAIDRKMYDRGELDIAAAERLLEKSPQLADKYKQNTPAGTTSDPLVVTTTTPTGSTPAATPTTSTPTTTGTTINAQNVTVTSTGTGEKKLATEDLFSRDPALWLNKRLETLMQNYSGVNEYTADLNKSGSNWEERIKREFMDAKSSGEGGSVDWDQWWGKAQAGLPVSLASLEDSFTGLSSVLQTLQKSISDGSATSTEAERYLDEYNQATGKTTEYTKKQTSQTKDMMNATDAFTDAQTLYNKYMDDGKLSASEATTVNAALTQGLDLMGSAGADTKDKIAGLPPALKELASSIMDFFNQIKASVTQAQQDSMYDDGWRTATNSGYESMINPKTGKPVQRSYLDIDVILGLKEGPAKVDSLTESNKALQNSMYANVGTAGLLSSAYQAAGTAAIEMMNNVVNAAADKISQANAVINNLSYSNSGNSISASNYMPGMTSYQQGDGRQMFSGFRPGWRNPSPCGWGSAFESGGKVSETGTALVHEGEYILSRNEVERMGKGGANIQLNVNMNNSRFGNAEIAKDLPKLFARAARRAYFARGSI